MAIADTASEPRAHYRNGLRGWLEEVQRLGELLHGNGAHWEAETMQDAEYLAEAEKLNIDVNPVNGAEIDKLLGELCATPKELPAKAGQAATAR
jgi:hypothetical protein